VLSCAVKEVFFAHIGTAWGMWDFHRDPKGFDLHEIIGGRTAWQ
jgi:hypothetical protein